MPETAVASPTPTPSVGQFGDFTPPSRTSLPSPTPQFGDFTPPSPTPSAKKFGDFTPPSTIDVPDAPHSSAALAETVPVASDEETLKMIADATKASEDEARAQGRPVTTPAEQQDMVVPRMGTMGTESDLMGLEDQAKAPQWVNNAIEAAGETAMGFAPKSGSLKDVSGWLTGLLVPPVGATEEIKKTYGMVQQFVQGKPLEQAHDLNFPEALIIKKAEQTPPLSKERFAVGFNMLAQFGTAATIAQGLKGEPNATQEGNVTSNGQQQYQRASPQRVSTETGSSNLAPPSGEGTLENAPATAGGTTPEIASQVKKLLDDYDEGASHVSTLGDLANEVEALASETGNTQLQSAVDYYRGEEEYDRELGGRNDMDQTETEFRSMLEKASQPAAALPQGVAAASEAQTTGVANRVFQAEAEAGTLGEIPTGVGMSWQEMVARGRELLNKGADPYEIARRFKRSGRVSSDDFTVLRAERERLRVASNEAARASEDNPGDKGLADALTQARDAETAFVRDVVQPVKTATSDIFRGMQGEAPVDTSTFEGLRQMLLDEKGRKPTEAESQKLTQTAKKVRSTMQKEAAARSRIDKAIAREAARRKTPLPTDPEALKQHFAERLKSLLPC